MSNHFKVAYLLLYNKNTGTGNTYNNITVLSLLRWFIRQNI